MPPVLQTRVLIKKIDNKIYNNLYSKAMRFKSTIKKSKKPIVTTKLQLNML